MSEKIKVQLDEDFKKITEKYLANVAGQARAIEGLADQGNFEEILKQTHQLSGSGSSYGFDFITEIANRIDLAAKGRTPASLKSHLLELVDYLDRLEVSFVPEDNL